MNESIVYGLNCQVTIAFPAPKSPPASPAAAPAPVPPSLTSEMTATTAPLVVKHAATVVCARIRAKGVQTLALDEIRKGAELWSDDRVGHLFPKGGSEVSFTSGWELLMGQGECVNYLRSTPSVTKLMRYSGEYKFAGGGVDGNETLEAAGRRELEEEFLTVVPKNANLRLFKVMQVRTKRAAAWKAAV